MKIVSLDPGESTGWCTKDIESAQLAAGTLPKDHLQVFLWLQQQKPDLVVCESFHLFPGKAQSLSWNSFYPCEVIGIIKLYCMLYSVELVMQAPGVKKYAGGLQSDWHVLQQGMLKGHVTEHAKDAYMHLKYFERNGLKSKK